VDVPSWKKKEVFVAQLSGNAEISVLQIVWVTTNCCFVELCTSKATFATHLLVSSIKVHPRTGHEGPEGVVLSLTSAVNRSKGRFTHSMPCPCRAFAVPLPCSDSAVSFVKVRVVAGNIRTASSTV